MNCKDKTNTCGFFNNAYMLMMILLFLWGSTAAVSKLVLGSIDSYQMQFYMFGFSVLIMTIILASAGKLKELRTLGPVDYMVLFIYSIPSFLYYFFYTLAMKLIPAIEASMLNYLFPILIVVFAVPINKEKLNLAKVISLVLGFAGVVIIVTNGSFGNIKISNVYGDMLAIVAAASWAVFSNLLKRNKYDIVLSNYMFTVISFILSIISLFVFSKPVVVDIPTAGGILWLGLSSIVISYHIWTKALKISTSALLASLSFLTPFVTLMFIVILLKEKVTVYHLLGLGVIILGIIIQNIKVLLHGRMTGTKVTCQD